jgi:hypothetical protein
MIWAIILRLRVTTGSSIKNDFLQYPMHVRPIYKTTVLAIIEVNL